MAMKRGAPCPLGVKCTDILGAWENKKVKDLIMLAATTVIDAVVPYEAEYCSSLTCSNQSTAFPSSIS